MSIFLMVGRVVIPQKESDTFISTIGHLDGRLDLYRGDFMDVLNREMDPLHTTIPIESNTLMDLCMMASKLAYENANVVRNVVIDHWKANFSISYTQISLIDICMHFSLNKDSAVTMKQTVTLFIASTIINYSN